MVDEDTDFCPFQGIWKRLHVLDDFTVKWEEGTTMASAEIENENGAAARGGGEACWATDEIYRYDADDIAGRQYAHVYQTTMGKYLSL